MQYANTSCTWHDRTPSDIAFPLEERRLRNTTKHGITLENSRQPCKCLSRWPVVLPAWHYFSSALRWHYFASDLLMADINYQDIDKFRGIVEPVFGWAVETAAARLRGLTLLGDACSVKPNRLNSTELPDVDSNEWKVDNRRVWIRTVLCVPDECHARLVLLSDCWLIDPRRSY